MTDPARVTGLYTVDFILGGNWAALASSLHHLILPMLILGGFTLALVVRVTRAAIIEEMRRDYVRTARGKGFSERNVVIKHALRNVLIPAGHDPRVGVRGAVERGSDDPKWSSIGRGWDSIW